MKYLFLIQVKMLKVKNKHFKHMDVLETLWKIGKITVSKCQRSLQYLYVNRAQGSKFFFLTYSSCGASGINFSLVLTPVELVLKSGILKKTKHIIQ